MRKESDASVPVRVIASAMLFLALLPWPYVYYQMLRWLVCGACAWSAFLATNANKSGWAWAMAITAVLFNPIVPIYLSRAVWTVIDIGVGITLLVSLWHLRAEPK